jgi:membrane-associated phospholipid phosphatase
MVYDQEIYNFIGRPGSPQTENLSKYAIEPWGSGLYTLPLLGAIYLTGKKDSKHRQIALTGIKAFIISGAFSQVAKHIFHRHRPNDNDPPNPNLWDGPFPIQSSYTSFPSGHTTVAYSVASVLAYGYRDKLWVGISAYTMATLVGVSRVHDQKHWPSDVFGGAVLGTFIGITLSKLNFNNVDLFPIASSNSYGMGMVYHIR